MANKKKSWVSLLKKFFISDAKPEKEKRRKWFFGRLKIKRLPSITAPQSPLRARFAIESEEERSKHALDVAIATVAAAEAAVASAQAAAEVVRLTRTSQSDGEMEKSLDNDKTQTDVLWVDHSYELQIQARAALKIQTVFRSYLARKALRALKGIVKLQALIRGRAVRRQAVTTLKRLQSMINIQSRVCARRIHMDESSWHSNGSTNLQFIRDKIIKIDTNSQRRWDDSILTKEEADAMTIGKKEAAFKRERIKEYSFYHRKSAESEQNNSNGRWKYWLEQWVDTQVAKSKELEDLDLTSNKNPKEELGLTPRSYSTQYSIDRPVSPVKPIPKRSLHHKRQCSLGDDQSFSTTSTLVPTYMAATESAKAKTRSMSSPKLRPGNFDTQSESYSPYKNKMCIVSCSASEATSVGRNRQRSPSLKGNVAAVPMRLNRVFQDLSINSECSLDSWNQQYNFT